MSPLPDDKALVDALDSILSHKQVILQVIEGYSGASEEVKRSMTANTEEAKQECFSKLLVNVDAISNIFNYSLAFEQIIPPALHVLCGSPAARGDIATQRAHALNAAQSKSAVMQRIIELFAYVITFDNVRMMRPLVANDFSYYRRMLPSYHNHANFAGRVKVRDEDASQIALFTAIHNPVFSAVLKAVKTATASAGTPLTALSSFGGTGSSAVGIGGGALVNDLLATIANTCYQNIKTALAGNANNRSPHIIEAAKAMVVALVLYDHNTDLGVYAKKSTVRVKDIIDLLRKSFGHEGSLIGLIKYSSKNLSSAPEKIQEMLE